MPYVLSVQAESQQTTFALAAPKTQWLKAWPQNGSTNFIELGSRLVLQLRSADDLHRLTDGHSLQLSRIVASNIFILQAGDAATVALEADRLAALPEVLASYPVMRRQASLHGPYAPRSADPFFVPYFNLNPSYDAEWYLENRDYNGNRLGFDLNVLSAWPFGMGQGVTVAVADSGVDSTHYELTGRLAGAPSFNFDAQTTNAEPRGGADPNVDAQVWTHATSVAGLIAAEGNNGKGMVGVAPLANLASWVIYTTNEALVPDEQLMDMYQYAQGVVGVQNHSWGGGNGTSAQVGPTLLERIGIGNAVTLGRNGRGTVMVRSAGNDRGSFDPNGVLSRADDDGYPDDPEVISVGAVLKSGRVTTYSEPGACLLVAAPGGDVNGQGLFTLDLAGGKSLGVINYFGDIDNYRFGNFPLGFVGTSASAPLISGMAALMLSVNTNLTYRDVQQILVLSGRQWDLADPDVVTNGAGLLVSHNVGFGVPDAGHACWLASFWSNRSPLTTVSMAESQPMAIPDGGLRVEITGPGVPPGLSSIHCLPGTGPNADQPTPNLPLVDIGLATNVPAINLTNKGALILRGQANFDVKISNATQAGAAFAVIYNTNGADNLAEMVGVDFTPIPAVFISSTDGLGVQALFQTNASALARIHLSGTNHVFHLNSSLLCEQVGVRVQSDHQRRGDLRITLVSPSGTRSVLQAYGPDNLPGPVDWTYWSTHDFFESSIGDWTVSFGDEAVGNTGNVQSVTLIIRGTQIIDTDHDGLDDNWEMAHFGSLAYGPKDDPDNDNFSNAREQAMGTDPAVADIPFQLNLSPWQLTGTKLMRLSWPAGPKFSYQVWGGTNLASLTLLTNLAGTFPEIDWLSPYTETPQRFFRVHAVPVP